MILSIHQSSYLPWLGLYARIDAADHHVVLDHVQFEKNSFINRNRMRTWAGAAWLTVPVHLPDGVATRIADVQVADGPWARKHLTHVATHYARAPAFATHQSALNALWTDPPGALVAMNDRVDEFLRSALDIGTPTTASSSLSCTGTKSALGLEICQAMGASTYMSGPHGRDYLDIPAFAEAGIEVLYQDYAHPTYAQAQGGFEPFMSALDLVLNVEDDPLAIVREGQRTEAA